MYKFRFSIKHKVRITLSIIAILIIAMLIKVYINFINIKNLSDENVENIQPKLVAVNDLTLMVKNNMELLGLFLIGKSKSDLSDYHKNNENLKKTLQKTLSIIQDDKDEQSLNDIKKIRQAITDLHGLEEELLFYSKDIKHNQAAMKILDDDILPLETSIGHHLTLLNNQNINAVDNLKLSEVLNTYSSQTNQLSITLRTFLAFRNDSTLENFNLYKSSIQQLMQQLVEYESDMSEEQMEAMDEIRTLMTPYLDLAQKAIDVHLSDEWRRKFLILYLF